MSPVDSDLFQSADFSATFGKLDAVPGVTIVANYASLPATWGLNQHGSKVIQADNRAEWMWYNPSGTGQWIRTNTVGLISKTIQPTPITTTLTTSPGAVFVTSGNFTAPGGRALRIDLDMGIDNSSGASGIVIINVRDNGTQIAEYNFKPGVYISSGGVWVQATAFLASNTFTPGSTHNISAYVRASTGAVGVGGHGTSAARQSILSISEV
jgi:hypothetical protein